MRISTLKFFQRAVLVAVTTGLAAFNGLAQSSQTGGADTSGDNSSYKNSGSQTTGSENKADSKTTHFIKEAARDNDMEVALGEVGARKATNPDLKAFAQQLQQDHMQANQELQPIAQKYGVTIDQSTGKGGHEVSKFEKENSGAKWDQKFATEMLKSHEKDISKFQKAASELQAQDVRQYAQTMLPKLRQHFEHAETVAKAVGVDQSTISRYANKVGNAMGGTMGGTSDQFQSQQGAGGSELQNGSSTNTVPK